MLRILHERFKQKYRTMPYPDGPAPELSALTGAYLKAGLIGYWQPYEAVHLENIKKLQGLFKTVAK